MYYWMSGRAGCMSCLSKNRIRISLICNWTRGTTKLSVQYNPSMIIIEKHNTTYKNGLLRVCCQRAVIRIRQRKSTSAHWSCRRSEDTARMVYLFAYGKLACTHVSVWESLQPPFSDSPIVNRVRCSFATSVKQIVGTMGTLGSCVAEKGRGREHLYEFFK